MGVRHREDRRWLIELLKKVKLTLLITILIGISLLLLCFCFAGQKGKSRHACGHHPGAKRGPATDRAD